MSRENDSKTYKMSRLNYYYDNYYHFYFFISYERRGKQTQKYTASCVFSVYLLIHTSNNDQRTWKQPIWNCACWFQESKRDLSTRHYPPTLLPTRRWQTLPRRKAESFSEAETANRPVRFAVNTRGIRRNEESSWHRRRHRRRWTGVVKGRVVWQLSLPLLVNQPNEP